MTAGGFDDGMLHSVVASALLRSVKKKSTLA